MSADRQRVLVVLGTRPEVIKLAPVIRELRRPGSAFECRVCSTGQHHELVQQAMESFQLSADVQLDAMSSAQSLGRLTARLFNDLDHLLEVERPGWVLVQGDTTSAMAGAVSAYYRRIKVGHVEAGLRTFDRWAPFPEEINRTFIGHVADLHFAPTERAAGNLRAQRVPERNIHVTGNTVVDALHWMSERLDKEAPRDLDDELVQGLDGKRLILVTSHRRESFGRGLENICRALLEVVRLHPDVMMVYPVHLNPQVRKPVRQLLANESRIKLLDPVGYLPLLYLMKRSYCILSDSGGIQEEAPSFGKPIIILRETTERPEVLEAGCGRLAGTSCENIVRTTSELLEKRSVYESMARAKNPFGDGLASKRIVEAMRSP